MATTKGNGTRMTATTNNTLTADARIAQLETIIRQREADGKKVGSQNRKLKLVKLVAHLVQLVDTSKLTEEELMTLDGLLTEYTGHRYDVEIKLGDTLLGLWQKYSDVPKLKERIDKACEANGWRLNPATGIIEEAKK